MKLFTIGPVALYQSTKQVRLNDFVYFRTDEFSKLVTNTLSKLSNLLGNKEPNSLIYFAASGTAVMEATVENCISDNDKVIVINGGSFGHRFCELLEYHHKNFNSINLKWNEKLTLDHLRYFENKSYTMLFVNLHETQTGQLYDIKMLSKFCKQNNMMLVVDAISTFLADEYDMNKYGIDLTIISSQKGLCLSPGMSFVSFSKRMIEKIKNMPLPASKYFDFKDYLDNIIRGQTPYTPPVLVMYELQNMLELIEKEGGINTRLNFIKEKALYFRAKAKKLGLIIPNYPLSYALTPLYFKDIDAYKIFLLLKNKYRIFITPCSGNLEKNLLRIGHIGNTTISDIDDLLEKLTYCIEKVRNNEVIYENKTKIYNDKIDINKESVKICFNQ